ncbi:calcium/calmodulin-dependent protein kinase type 1-like [Anopheles nili]|uniref:calcium/calmodulin-dependent protein kinase type 1-like n=1 Tax=Anopheles nili TaxID=185578 RepID=UPI00237AF83F|nr:calcium/calmodulin-dependent protein kinase type 1-like [Anopheles nili]
MHEQGVVHRDLKPENMMYSSAAEDIKIMLTDFGLSMMEGSSSTRSVFGSIGVISYILLCENQPFDAEDEENLIVQNLKGEFEFNSSS